MKRDRANAPDPAQHKTADTWDRVACVFCAALFFLVMNGPFILFHLGMAGYLALCLGPALLVGAFVAYRLSARLNLFLAAVVGTAAMFAVFALAILLYQTL